MKWNVVIALALFVASCSSDPTSMAAKVASSAPCLGQKSEKDHATILKDVGGAVAGGEMCSYKFVEKRVLPKELYGALFDYPKMTAEEAKNAWKAHLEKQGWKMQAKPGTKTTAKIVMDFDHPENGNPDSFGKLYAAVRVFDNYKGHTLVFVSISQSGLL